MPFAETVARQATKSIADEVHESHLRQWYRPGDLLPGGVETVIGHVSALETTVERVMRETGPAGLPLTHTGKEPGIATGRARDGQP
ncbi:hypothetical protein ACIRQT_31925 [Streptomyces californicus]|uniref:hypothetical protein n=1 Tax=Streptomyces TaxID=1883 RepID=UPI0036E35C1D